MCCSHSRTTPVGQQRFSLEEYIITYVFMIYSSFIYLHHGTSRLRGPNHISVSFADATAMCSFDLCRRIIARKPLTHMRFYRTIFPPRARATSPPTLCQKQQITFNYCYVRYDEEARECLCGHPNCLQTLGTSRDDLASGDAAGGGEGRGGLGQGSGAGRGRSSKATPKVQDPETGETVRPWLDKEDAEVRGLLKYGLGSIDRGRKFHV